MKADVGVRTDVGRVRDGNEDSYFVREPLFVIADGMGGHAAGEVASQTAVEVITNETSDGPPDPSTLNRLVRAANRAIWQKAQGDASLHGMGTTCTVLLLEGTKAHFAHVGDSRAYLLRDGRLAQVTEDHTLVQRLVQEGRIAREEADHHPQRNIITRSLGVDSDVQVDTFSLDVKAGDRFVINSDGLNSMIDNPTIEATLKEASSAQEAADRLVELANEAGGEDNITVLVIDIQGDAPAPGGEDEEAARARAKLGVGVQSEGMSASSPAAPPNTDADTVAPVNRSASSDLLSIPGARSKLKPKWGRIVVALILLVLILGGSGYFAFRTFVIGGSYYVGVNESGLVTIYRGLPGEFAGLELHEEEDVTDLALADVPEFLQENVEQGIDAATLEEAQARVADLEARAQDKEFGDKLDKDRAGDNTGDKAGDRKRDRNNG